MTAAASTYAPIPGVRAGSGDIHIAEALDPRSRDPLPFLFHLQRPDGWHLFDIRDGAGAAKVPVPFQLTSPFFADSRFAKLDAVVGFLRRHGLAGVLAPNPAPGGSLPAAAAPPDPFRAWWKDED